jgi:protein tyrosine/serine phosphatase
MRDEARSQGVDMPKQYYLQLFNLMRDSGTEGEYSNTENEYFHDHPSQGAIIQNSIEGTDKEAPSHYSKNEVKKFVSNWNKYFEDQNYDQFIDTIRKSVTHECRRDGNEYIPTVTLIHCNHGRDRVGQVSGSYLMKYAGWNFLEVSALNYQVGGLDSPIVFSNQRAMVWYCQYLVEEEGFSMKKLQCNDEENMSSGDESIPEYMGEVSSITGSASSLVCSLSLSLFVLAVSVMLFL